MVQACAADSEVGLPISGIGGIASWRDAAEFIALGSTSLQVCTAIMHYGFRIVEDMIEGLESYMDAKGYRTLDDFRGRAVAKVERWENLDLRFQRVARIDYEKCIGCNLCYIACEDGAHQCIDLRVPAEIGVGLGPGRVPHKPVPKVREVDCVGCNLCSLVCPVDDCITMVEISNGDKPLTWSQYQAKVAAGEMKPFDPHP
jgi:dihydropyrimidine dehydrogenase (NAD+) subunit PreA